MDFQAIAQRTVNAENNFIENVISISGCTKIEAEKVLSVYRKFKIVKMDAVVGVISVKHGAFLDADAIKNAINF
jgi:hypothetical protein